MEKLKNLITETIQKKTCSAISLEVLYKDRLLYALYEGTTSLDAKEAVNKESIYDLASLTKPLVTAMLSGIMIDKNILCLEDNTVDIFDQFALVFNKNLKDIKIENLLNHSSGLEAWEPIYKVIDNRSDVYMLVRSRSTSYPTGTKHLYSDLGYIMLSELLEILNQKKLDILFNSYIAGPLSLSNTNFITPDLANNKKNIVSTGYSMVRKRPLTGEVNDENCFVMDGVSGHAGLFAPIGEVSKLVTHIKNCILGKEKQPLISRSTMERLLSRSKIDPQWCCGWHYPSMNSSAGTFISPNSIGMTGFTGTSVWIDLEKDVIITLLANRTVAEDSAKFGWETDDFSSLRPEIHNIILGELR